jgi:hypothetical protein
MCHNAAVTPMNVSTMVRDSNKGQKTVDGLSGRSRWVFDQKYIRATQEVIAMEGKPSARRLLELEERFAKLEPSIPDGSQEEKK